MKKMFLMLLVLLFAGSAASFASKLVKTYYPDGKPRSVLKYNDRMQMDGAYRYYWPNGRLKEKGVYKNGVRVGPVKRWTVTGARL